MSSESSSKDSEDAVITSARNRKKRKWDQPAESLLSAGLVAAGTLPLGLDSLVGVTHPAGSSLNYGLLPGSIPASCKTITQLFQAPKIQQSAVALADKLNQSKAQVELIAREIVINDAEPTIRYRLTKRQTQEEIQKSTGAIVITRGKYRSPNELSDNEKPLYLHISAGADLKDTAERIKAVDRAASIIEGILKEGQMFRAGSATFPAALNTGGLVTQNLCTCVFLGFEPDKSLNIADRIRGPNGQYISHIMNVTGATVVLRGRGSENSESLAANGIHEPLHLYLSSNNSRSLEEAKTLAENLLDTISVECGVSRVSSCKIYSSVPPPQQLLIGAQSLTVELNTGALPSVGSSCPALCPSEASLSPAAATCTSFKMQPSMTTLIPGDAHFQPITASYPQKLVTGGTNYSGYGGIYPQATPLQQVALALRQVPASNLSPLPMEATSSEKNLNIKANTSSSAEQDRRPQRRKFQEMAVASAAPSATYQEPNFVKLDVISEMQKVSTMSRPRKLIQPAATGMPPPPPRGIKPTPPRDTRLPPPSKSSTSQSPPDNNSNSSAPMEHKIKSLSDPLMKLMEYGEEDEDDTNESFSRSRSESLPVTTAKPFWAI